jgi:hypothetical protein
MVNTSLSRRHVVSATAVLILALSCGMTAQAPVLRIVDRVQPVCGAGADDSKAIVVVHVLSVQAQPMDGVTVTLATKRRDIAMQMLTDTNGQARFVLSADAEVRLGAQHVGFATSVAERVKVKLGCMSGVTLPLQVEPPRDTISN